MKTQALRLLTIMLGASLFAFSAQAEKMYGVFMVVKGKVQIQNGAGKNTDAKVGTKIYEGESVVTVVDARAKIVMADRNVLNVSPETTLKIAKYENGKDSKNVELDLSKGKVRTNVEQTYDGEKSKFEIKTPTAVAGVRGTQFMMGFDGKNTSVVTFKGSVTLATLGPNRQPAGAPVTVNKGETSTVSSGKAPTAPKALPKEEMKKFEGESTVTVSGGSSSTGASEQKSRGPASDSSSGSDGSKDRTSSVDAKSGTLSTSELKPDVVVTPPPPLSPRESIFEPPKPPGPPIPQTPQLPKKTTITITPKIPGT